MLNFINIAILIIHHSRIYKQKEYQHFNSKSGSSGKRALGFWKALSKVFPETAHQRCWVHKTENVLNKLPKTVQPKVKQTLHEIWMAPTKKDADKAFGIAVSTYSDKYPKAMECLVKDKEEMLAIYDFPTAHWQYIRTRIPLNRPLPRCA